MSSGVRKSKVADGLPSVAFRFALDPNAHAEHALNSHAGAARFAFNWGLARVKANLSQREAERSYAIPADELTPYVDWSHYGLRLAWNAAKDDVAPWWRENSKEAYSTGLANLAAALNNWSTSKRGTRKGKRVGFPRFKKAKTATPSIRFSTGTIRCEAGHAMLPVIGRVKLHEPATRLLAVDHRIRSATVRRARGRWFVSFSVGAHIVRDAPVDPDAVVGVDLGVKALAVLSTGETIPNPKHLTVAKRKLRRAQRRLSRRTGPDRRTGQQPSGRWCDAKRAVRQVHARVADARRDAHHKLTTDLTARFGTLVVEDLNVAGMVRNHRLAKAISDAAFGELRRQVTYKADWRGGRVIVADRWFPFSKTCSRCKTVKTKLSLRERVFRCEACGLVLDRDLNAAVNLAQYGQRILEQQVAGSGSETVNGCGADRKPSSGRRAALKRQPGTRADRGRPGTVHREVGRQHE